MSEVAYDGKVWVREVSCDACLFSPNRIVSGGRAADIVRATREQDGATFICHKSQVSDEAPSICRAWFDRFGSEDLLIRMATAMDLIAELPTKEKQP